MSLPFLAIVVSYRIVNVIQGANSKTNKIRAQIKYDNNKKYS